MAGLVCSIAHFALFLITTLFLALSRIESGHLTGFMTLAILLVVMVAQAF